MNDMAFLCEVAISDAGGLAHCDLGELNQALHRNINSSRGYQPPVELAAQQLERGQSSGQQTRQEQAPTQLTPRLVQNSSRAGITFRGGTPPNQASRSRLRG